MKEIYEELGLSEPAEEAVSIENLIMQCHARAHVGALWRLGAVSASMAMIVLGLPCHVTDLIQSNSFI